MRNATLRTGVLLGVAALTVALAAYLVLSGPLAPRVPLRTTADQGPGAQTGCYLANTTGLLIADEAAGTRIVSEDMAKSTVPVTWPVGFTARRSLFGQVDVLDRNGHVVATTGNRYELLGGYATDGAWLACSDGVYPPSW
jgi:hypothetical protein